MSASPYLLPWTPEESKQAHKAWKASCGPHAIAAALSIRLHEVHAVLVGFRGWMNPTMMRATLRALQVRVGLAMRVKVKFLCNGLNFVQWEGPWLARGVPNREAYRHTHWVAHWEGWVLCTAVDPNAWLPVAEWARQLKARGDEWHVRGHYRLFDPPQPRGESCRAAAAAPAAESQSNLFEFEPEDADA